MSPLQLAVRLGRDFTLQPAASRLVDVPDQNYRGRRTLACPICHHAGATYIIAVL